MKRLLIICLACSFLALPMVASAQVHSVEASVETEPVPNGGDAADDPAIWVHPTDAAKSVVIGTNKLDGIAVYDLSGNELQYLSDGKLNNVDVRYGFDFDGVATDIAVVGERNDDIVKIYAIDANDGTLTSITGDAVDAELNVYGACLYKSQVDESVYVFVNAKSGDVVQHRLVANQGVVNLERVRSLSVPSQVEGCVADDDNGTFFLGEESSGIWSFGAEPSDSTDGTLIATTGDRLTADVEGLALFQTSDGGGYLLASSQGNNTYVAFEREPPHNWKGTFEIIDGANSDGTSDTDGIDVASTGLGAAFPDGIFVAQDGHNEGGNQNFKFVSWTTISSEAGLLTDPGFDPRASSEEPDVPGEDAGPGDDAGSVADAGVGGDSGSDTGPDAQMPNVGPPDAGTDVEPDGADFDAGQADASGTTSSNTEDGCGCGHTGGAPASVLAIFIALGLVRLPWRSMRR